MIEQRPPSRRMRGREGQIGMRKPHQLRDGGFRRVRRAVAMIACDSQLLFERGKRTHIGEQHELIEIRRGVVDRAHRAAGFFGEATRPQLGEAPLGDGVLGGGHERLPQPVAPPHRRIRLNCLIFNQVRPVQDLMNDVQNRS
jgi:hypothetical protein